MKGLHLKLLGAVALALVTSASLASAQSITTLDQAIDLALANEPSVLAARAGIDRAQAGVDGALAARRGNVRLQGQAAVGSNDYGQGFDLATPYSISIGYERMLWDNRANLAGIEGAKSTRVASEALAALARSQVRAEVARAWIDLAVALQQVSVAQANLTAVVRFERDAGLQFEAGEVARSVVAQATARRAQAQADLEQANNGVVIAGSELTRLTGQDAPLAALPLTYPTIPISLPDAMSQLGNHPALRAADAQIAASRSGVAQAQGRAGPQVVGGVRAVHVRDEFLPKYRNDGLEGYVRFTAPLWDGGARSASVSGARAGVSEAEAGRTRTQRSLENGLRQAYAARATAQAQVTAANAMVAAARSALESMEAEFRVGERPMVDLLDARRDLTGAETALLRARGAFILSHWWIDAALGRGG
jgi:outer membrane protein